MNTLSQLRDRLSSSWETLAEGRHQLRKHAILLPVGLDEQGASARVSLPRHIKIDIDK